jgi:hypothetical protein
MNDPSNELGLRLRQVKLWCRTKYPYVNIKDGLRTPELEPALSDSPSFPEMELAVTALAQRREQLLAASGTGTPYLVQEAAEGKLLICEVSSSIWSGESEAETEGFFDVCDIPPWDTWVYCVGVEQLFRSGDKLERETAPVLVSWVPSELVGLVTSGINVNPYDCIYWASSVDTELTRRLRAQGLLT